MSSDPRRTRRRPVLHCVEVSRAGPPMLLLHGVTRKIGLEGRKLGQTTDAWGRHRVGFEATVTLNTLDFDMRFPPSNQVLLELYIEGVSK